MTAKYRAGVFTMLQPGRVSRGLSIPVSHSFVHLTLSVSDSVLTAYPWLFASLNAQTVMVPWWHVAHSCSFRHFTASLSRNASPRSTDVRVSAFVATAS